MSARVWHEGDKQVRGDYVQICVALSERMWSEMERLFLKCSGLQIIKKPVK